MQNKSETEMTYEKIQNLVGGNVPWGQLHPMHQMQFIQAVNAILSICSGTK